MGREPVAVDGNPLVPMHDGEVRPAFHAARDTVERGGRRASHPLAPRVRQHHPEAVGGGGRILLVHPGPSTPGRRRLTRNANQSPAGPPPTTSILNPLPFQLPDCARDSDWVHRPSGTTEFPGGRASDPGIVRSRVPLRLRARPDLHLAPSASGSPILAPFRPGWSQRTSPVRQPSPRGASMKIKAAVLYEPNTPLVVETVDLDEPKDGEVLVRMASAGVCHSDYHVMKGRMDDAASDGPRPRSGRNRGEGRAGLLPGQARPAGHPQLPPELRVVRGLRQRAPGPLQRGGHPAAGSSSTARCGCTETARTSTTSRASPRSPSMR